MALFGLFVEIQQNEKIGYTYLTYSNVTVKKKKYIYIYIYIYTVGQKSI